MFLLSFYKKNLHPKFQDTTVVHIVLRSDMDVGFTFYTRIIHSINTRKETRVANKLEQREGEFKEIEISQADGWWKDFQSLRTKNQTSEKRGC